ncbi:MAG: metalloregulator ArsR/SmtB family transcription factor [Dokdonella sp.]|jgi:DNA-binding transcriptional ArsR family regulator|nr:metalloregulator ArsR/SmtB family transcription factor [Dokdonella sp.]
MRASASQARLIEAAPVFAALGDPARLTLVSRLCSEGPLSIVRLTEGAQMSRQAVTKHLNALSDAGLVHSERSGRERVWQLRPRRIDEVRRYLDQISLQWDAALDRLRDLVEDG